MVRAPDGGGVQLDVREVRGLYPGGVVRRHAKADVKIAGELDPCRTAGWLQLLDAPATDMDT